jgi:hypothetical protein
MTYTPGEGQPSQDPAHDPYSSQQGQPQYGYPQQRYGSQPPMQYAPDHPRATTVLVLGILGVVLCQVIAPFAWSMGKKTVDEIDLARGALGGRSAAQAGYVLGIVGTVILGVSLVFLVLYFVIIVAVIGGGLFASSSG